MKKMYIKCVNFFNKGKLLSCLLLYRAGAGFTKPLRLTKARLSEFSRLVYTTNALVSQIVQL